jgi:hypothetical protein
MMILKENYIIQKATEVSGGIPTQGHAACHLW